MMTRVLFAVVGIVALVGVAAADTLPGFSGTPNTPPLRAEDLYKGDLGAELGIGCSSVGGTSGGPNDVAQGLTATETPPFDVTEHFYYIYTQVSPNITSLSFVCWEGGASPGDEFFRQAGMDWSVGSHTVPIAGCQVFSSMFYVGHNQAQSNVGMRWGLDTNSGNDNTSFIRAPSCGLSSWGTLASIGYPGYWVFSVSTGGPVPVELKTWGEVKATYN
jgi:hypothetical protein